MGFVTAALLALATTGLAAGAAEAECARRFAAALAAARAARRLASDVLVLALALRAVLPLTVVRRDADVAAELLRLCDIVDPTGAFAFLVTVPDPFLLAFFRAAMTEKIQTR
jgi:hypothetical protein